MISKAQENKIKELRNKKGREKYGLCLVEGKKNIQEAGELIEFTFTKEDVENFNELVTTQTPQVIAAVAGIPNWTLKNIKNHHLILITDGVQDPGNIGAILRLCLAFDASLILVESADPTNSKVIRSSAGALFKVAWIQQSRDEITKTIASLERNIYRIEKRSESIDLKSISDDSDKILIVGSEGNGIKLNITGTSLVIKHNAKLESLNVATATAIVLQYFYK